MINLPKIRIWGRFRELVGWKPLPPGWNDLTPSQKLALALLATGIPISEEAEQELIDLGLVAPRA